ncbi:MAG: hypothetical protein HN742_40830 [Lentisphaerae bacterium]|jgi:hypothetical protein|nr:hypothetical protein [Lentisphaerota bacterium]MBT4821372.1 hypothetical protein [Lentisphaerota bacterium]MBT5606274.1 hypothetical protein [Lentisphaerota bacterium]MBT7059386.1 hypothetical protein [Lentisphaerota bacterium]MBT7848281.1 hypothetical protein [Lentisphaerota bacterium]
MPIAPQKTVDDIRLCDFTSRVTSKPVLATTAMYGPWLPSGEFDTASYQALLRDVLEHDSVPATNVDTTWAQYNDWSLVCEIVRTSAQVALDYVDRIPSERPLLVIGLNTNGLALSPREIPEAIRRNIEDLSDILAEEGLTRVRYMPVPDHRLIGQPRAVKVDVYREIGKVVADATDHGLVLFELDIGIPNFGSDFNLSDIGEILTAVPEIQEYKSAVIAPKPGQWSYDYDFRDDVARIALVEQVAPDRVQFSTGNDWCISLARLGANLPRFGYLLGASQMSPQLFRLWRELIEADDPAALPLEQDLQNAARDFWTPGNVGIYRHYVAILLALTEKIAHALPHPNCDAHFQVRPEDYWLPLKHALRLGLVPREDAAARARAVIPGASDMPRHALAEKVRLLG